MKYIKTLDGLRAIAVLLVIISHWVSKSHWLNYLPNGAIGVTIFFVLSGYLISSILFSYKDKIDADKGGVWSAIKVFYIRRSLRIFPIYYLFVLFLFFYGYTLIQDQLAYFLAYSSNILFFKRNELGGTVSHLWSLSVEEQYYLLWPILVLTVNRRFTWLLIVVFILTGLSFQIIFVKEGTFFGLLPFAAFDAFGFGALLAFVQRYHEDRISTFSKVINFVSLVILTWLIITQIYSLELLIPAKVVMSVFSLFVLFHLVVPSKNAISFFYQKMFTNDQLVFCGKISYGIYLYHTLIPGFSDNYYYKIIGHSSFLSHDFFFFVFNIMILLMVSSLSWFIVEKPFNSLKSKYNFQ
ncbi:acyltransferase family protein [Ohtaekwangia koreensis]|uniref:Peptidoglycan/LPS O-acetylase OafA/YrhL, contains acyltransferase and SGNH-hydrolase domains n=1 Tax=Ohtaekwangia koreensis TaxID=688867 RepID=A0A1T5M517_9BACT|nr:acyltransferase [Ohtaekwangia koreensis]SKC82959.1 Peptidoglycan/LPS O-acetylase OafA/YrhL, contains acyltransferase and SGNH-hydrolase domains [Ohtaekwangia koreensis]